jgi:prepilin-type N-terminal cleavage/methylation domain-containing protein
MKRTTGFTLIELLVVITIMAILSALMVPMITGAMARARSVSERACARNLMIGFYNYAHDHDGQLMAGYRNEPTTGPDGTPLAFPASARYPWRLMPYAGGVDKRIMWAIPSSRNMVDTSSEAYSVSVTPTFGMNTFYVGGDDSGLSGQGIKPTEANFNRFGKFALTHIDESINPSRQIVFASARMTGQNGKTVPGYYMVQAPAVVGTLWSSKTYAEDSPPAHHGYVDFRYENRAVVAHLDGHVDMLGETDLRDMRRWSNLAAMADDPNHRLGQ